MESAAAALGALRCRISSSRRASGFARAVRGDDHDRRLRRLDRAQLRNRHLEVGQHFQQVGLERLVRAVELVDQQYGRIALERARQWALDQEFVRVDLRAELGLVLLAGGFREADLDHLARVVPLVGRLRDVEALVALEADQLAPERERHHLADLGLADTRLALEEKGTPHGKREEKRRGEAAIGHVLARGEQGLRFIDRLRKAHRHGKRLKERDFPGFECTAPA